MPATTELSTPPDMATTTRVSSGFLLKSSVFTVLPPISVDLRCCLLSTGCHAKAADFYHLRAQGGFNRPTSIDQGYRKDCRRAQEAANQGGRERRSVLRLQLPDEV